MKQKVKIQIELIECLLLILMLTDHPVCFHPSRPQSLSQAASATTLCELISKSQADRAGDEPGSARTGHWPSNSALSATFGPHIMDCCA